jgi:hypothetical protein
MTEPSEPDKLCDDCGAVRTDALLGATCPECIAYRRGLSDGADYIQGYAQAVRRAGYTDEANTLVSVMTTLREMAGRVRLSDTPVTPPPSTPEAGTCEACGGDGRWDIFSEACKACGGSGEAEQLPEAPSVAGPSPIGVAPIPDGRGPETGADLPGRDRGEDTAGGAERDRKRHERMRRAGFGPYRVSMSLIADDPEQPQPAPDLSAVVGKWPGDETDEQLAEAMRSKPAKSTLRERAERIASRWCDGEEYEVRASLADAIESEARAFAEMALRQWVSLRFGSWWKTEGECWRLLADVPDEGPSGPGFAEKEAAESHLQKVIAAALEAAEKGE